MNFFKTIGNSTSVNSKKEKISNLIIQLNNLEINQNEYYISKNFDFVAWFERELEEMK